MSGFVGSLLGTFLSQWLSDYLATFLAKRNRGVYEPEFRLVIMIPYIILAVAGLVAFGASVTNQDPWPVPVVVGFGVFALGTQLGILLVLPPLLNQGVEIHTDDRGNGSGYLYQRLLPR
jgi:ABC-type spermidine/putrescine transport system permease subunit II